MWACWCISWNGYYDGRFCLEFVTFKLFHYFPISTFRLKSTFYVLSFLQNKFETRLMEVEFVLNELVDALNALDEWAKPEKVCHVDRKQY